MPNALARHFLSPISKETKDLLQQRWAQLPAELKTINQVVGKHWVQCGFITGPSYCSFGCTHCYLPKNANHMKTPELIELKQQIDANRRLLGPGGHLQITGGDLVDAYVKTNRFDELIEIVRYTNASNLVPMLMTHGQSLLEQPERLYRLINEGGLRKISFHIDTTQAGRAGYPIKSLHRESDLNHLRDQFTDLILRARKMTGKRLVGAQTVTVSEKNISSIGDIIEWQISNRKNLQAFSTLSFQPEADVGRTRISSQPVNPDLVWQKLCQSTGQSLVRDSLVFGHPDCSSIAMLLVDTQHQNLIDILPANSACSRFWSALLMHFGGIGGRGTNNFAALISKLAIVLRHPSLISRSIHYGLSILKSQSKPLQLFKSALQGQVGAFKIVMHNFIDAKKLTDPDPVTQARLDACSFRGAIKVDGKWQAVPMCTTNAKYR